MRTFGAIVLLLMLGVASADDGYSSVGNGLYKYGNGSGYFTRFWTPGYTSRCCYYPGYWTYKQVDYTPPVAVVTPPAITDEDFDKKVIDYLSLEAKLAQRADVIKTLAQRLPQRAQLQYGYNIQGSTQTYYGQVYAYQPPQAQLINPNEALQQYGRIVENVQTAQREAVAGFAGVTSQVTTESTKAAQIAAALNGAANVVRATQESKVQTTQFQAQSGPVQNGAPHQPPDLPQKQFAPNAWAASAQRCAECHAGGKKEGGFDVNAFPTMEPEQQLRVFRRLLEDKPGKPRMPLNPDGSAGQLPAGELGLWIPRNAGPQMAPAK